MPNYGKNTKEMALISELILFGHNFNQMHIFTTDLYFSCSIDFLFWTTACDQITDQYTNTDTIHAKISRPWATAVTYEDLVQEKKIQDIIPHPDSRYIRAKGYFALLPSETPTQLPKLLLSKPNSS